MNAFLSARTAFGFEYLISFRAEHSNAEISQESEIDKIDPKIKRIRSQRFKGGEISEYGFSNFPETGRISGPEVGDGTKPDVPTTARQNQKKQENFKNIQATTVTNRFNLSPLPPFPHWIQQFNIQASVSKIVTSESPENSQ